MTKALNVDEEKINSKAIKSTRARVINIKDLLTKDLTVQDFINSIADFILKKYNAEIVEEPYSERIDELTRRNGSKEWLYPENDYIAKYSIHRKKKYPFGIIEVMLEMKNDIINDIKIIGDFFGVKDVSEFESFLKGTSINIISESLDSFNIGEYIYGMTSDDFLSLIK